MRWHALAALALLLLAGCAVPEEEQARRAREQPSVRDPRALLRAADPDHDAPPYNWTYESPSCPVILLGRIRSLAIDPGADASRPWRIEFEILECLKGTFGETHLDVWVANPWQSLQAAAEADGPLEGRLVLIATRYGPTGRAGRRGGDGSSSDWIVNQYRGMRLVRSDYELRSWLGKRYWRSHPDAGKE
jgi:hypothetical protein